MDGVKVISVIWFCCLAGIASASAPGQAGFTIAVRESESMTAVYLEHAGPYWSLGPIFEKVRAYMREGESSGSLYVKYLSDPARDRSPTRAMEIGFLTRDTPDATPPFLVRRREPLLVASAQVSAGGFNLGKVCRTMKAWIASQGLEMIGPVIEIHGSVRSVSEKNPTIEIQVPVRKPAEAVEGRRSVALAGPWPGDDRPIDVAAAEAQKDGVEATPLALEKSDIVSADEQDKPCVGPPAGLEAVEEVATPLVGREASDGSARITESTNEEGLSWLYEQGRYDRLARQLIPDGGKLTAAQRLWCGHLVSRVKAVGNGVRKVFPDSAPGVQGLTDAIVARYQHACGSYDVDPLDSVDARTDASLDRRAGAKNAIIRKIDRLLWRIAIGKIKADETGGELVRILEEAGEILRASK